MDQAFKRVRPELLLLLLSAALTRLWNVFSPHAVIFDEVYFKAFAGHYLDHRYFFDIHPPLGKLLLAAEASLQNVPVADLISTTTPTPSLRLLPAIAGIILVPLVWGLLRCLGASRPWAFLGAFAVLLDNALVVESRLIVMDSMLLIFGISAIYFAVVSRTSTGLRRWLLIVATAVACGAAVSTKWTGATAIGVVGLFFIIDGVRRISSFRRVLIELLVIMGIVSAIYAGSFALHFSLLTRSGDGDAFMSQRFQATIPGNNTYDPAARMSFGEKFIELNREMFSANQTLTASHPYGSRWYTWPLELRPIYYWQGDTQPDGRQGNIYLLGNPMVWWGTVLTIIIGGTYARLNAIKLSRRTVSALWLTGVAYLANFLPFVGVTRVMFLYHYFFSFIFSIVFAVLLAGDIVSIRKTERTGRSSARYLFAGALLIIVAGFVYFLPLTYGVPLTPAELQAHVWLRGWR